MGVSFDTREWPSLLNPPWEMALLLSSLVLLIVVLIWRRRLSTISFIENLYASWQAALPIYRHSLPALTAELERARRYRHKLSVVILSTHHGQHKKPRLAWLRASNPEEPASPFFFSLMNPLVRDNLRHSDIVTYDVKDDHYVLLFPESSAVAAQHAIVRITGLVLQRSGTRLRHGVAEFPTDGLILEDLVNLAYARMCRAVSDRTVPPEAAEEEPEVRPSVIQLQ